MRTPPRRARRLLLPAGLIAVALAVGGERLLAPEPAKRPDLQQIVTGSDRLAPGAVAYVVGPHGTWVRAAGVANTATREPMRPDARMRLESVTKIFTATLVLQLAEQGRLRTSDTVERWLPGLLPYGEKITIRQLLTMRGGLLDRDDFTRDGERYIANVKDRRLREQLIAVARRSNANPATEVSTMWWIRFQAWQPLLFAPGTGYHYSNVGYELLGLIAERAGGKPIADLYRERIFAPLGLRHTAFDPQGLIAGPHATGYLISGGRMLDASAWHWGAGADSGIVSDARDTATFMLALMRGKLIGARSLDAMRDADLWRGGRPSGCGGKVYGWSGAAVGYKTDAWVDARGSRVAVLLLNARRDERDHRGDQIATSTALRLYCTA